MSRLTRLLLTFMLFATVSYAQADATDAETDPASYGERVLQEINAERVSGGLPALHRDDHLQQLAEGWAIHLVATGEFRHRPDLLARASDHGFTSITENVWRADQPLPPQRVVSTWLKSPGHAKNLRSPGSKFGGVGVAFADSGRVVVVFNGGAMFRLEDF